MTGQPKKQPTVNALNVPGQEIVNVEVDKHSTMKSTSIKKSGANFINVKFQPEQTSSPLFKKRSVPNRSPGLVLQQSINEQKRELKQFIVKIALDEQCKKYRELYEKIVNLKRTEIEWNEYI